jgi:hypothetical protein
LLLERKLKNPCDEDAEVDLNRSRTGNLNKTENLILIKIFYVFYE